MNPRCLIVLAGLAGCSTRPPARVLDAGTSQAVYEATLKEIKTIVTPKAAAPDSLHWERRVYVNEIILVAPDSNGPRLHDRAWLDKITNDGLVAGHCGQPPATACPESTGRVFTSLGIPWTREGDTAVVETGMVTERPDTKFTPGVFRTMLLTRDRDTGEWRVFDRGAPRFLDYTPPDSNRGS